MRLMTIVRFGRTGSVSGPSKPYPRTDIAMTVEVIGHGMSHTDIEGSSDDVGSERLLRLEAFAADLNAKGYTDVLVLRRESGRDVLTDARLTIVEFLDRHGEEVESVSDLARRLGRDKGPTSRDLRRLAELDIIDYEGEGDGEAKRPVLKHDSVVIEPVVY